MELISANASISIAELALIMAVTKRTVDRDFAWLKERGYISREGNSKKGYWKILKAIEDTGFDGPLTIEIELDRRIGESTPEEAIHAAVEYLRKYIE